MSENNHNNNTVDVVTIDAKELPTTPWVWQNPINGKSDKIPVRAPDGSRICVEMIDCWCSWGIVPIPNTSSMSSNPSLNAEYSNAIQATEDRVMTDLLGMKALMSSDGKSGGPKRTGRIKEVDTFYGSLAELKKYRWQSIVSKGNQKLDEQGNPATDPNTGEPKFWDDNMEFKFRYKPPSFVPCIDIVSSFNEQVQLDLGSPENKEAIKHKPGKERKVFTPDWHCLPNKKWKKLVFFFDGVIFTDKGPKLWITPRKIVVDVEPKYNFISKTSTADKAAMVLTSSSSSSSSSSSASAAPVVSSSVVVPSPLVSSLPTKVDITKDTSHKAMNEALGKKKE